MAPHAHQNENEDVLWKAREYDKRNLQTQDIVVEKLQRLENEFAAFRVKVGMIMFLGSTAVTLILHILAKYFKLT